ncbi:MAG: tRNA pseudouridine(38-40) synthase TruA [Erysipelotrichaceae bacterium]|nr:tRNA pseudouridine(38-40) synthase TruA [Erysipelotrichaceae bacterium]
MHRYKVIVSYIGKDYSGWQRQDNSLGIQEVIENVINKITKENNSIIAAGRTDAKVNSKGQTFHFDSNLDMNNEKWKYALNSFLPDDIYINEVVKVDELFHARYCALYKKYEYIINIGDYNVFNKDYVFSAYYDLDINKMKEASLVFIGYHDFTSFNSSFKSVYPNQYREIFNIEFIEKNDLIKIIFKGNGFLRYMVRMIVSALIEVGRGRLSSKDLKDILEKKDKNLFNKNIDATGLTLLEVKYFELVYLDNEYLIRDIHKEDQRVLNDFKNNYKNNIDIDENTYMICPRNKEEVLGLIKVNGCVELLCADDKFKLNNKMMEVLEKRYQ